MYIVWGEMVQWLGNANGLWGGEKNYGFDFQKEEGKANQRLRVKAEVRNFKSCLLNIQ